MASTPTLPPARHIPFQKGGWGAAIATTALAAALFATAWYIHEQTYRHPTDYMMRTYPHESPGHGEAGGHGADASHGSAPAGGASQGAGAAHGAAPAAGTAPAAGGH